MKRKRIFLGVGFLLFGCICGYLFQLNPNDTLSSITFFLMLGVFMITITCCLLLLDSFPRIHSSMHYIEEKVKNIFTNKNDTQKLKIAFFCFLIAIISFFISYTLMEGTVAFFACLIGIYSIGTSIIFIIRSKTKVREFILAIIEILFLMNI